MKEVSRQVGVHFGERGWLVRKLVQAYIDMVNRLERAHVQERRKEKKELGERLQRLMMAQD